ncbi:Hypothetical predicted protein [Mytilus galloprovincialis]|uniref:Core-binding (CB) domain-containing protein n=1 Tax=Mytilus galloprovincialis TaxID=29158 RepID=A0A8B6BZE5_MYTGA|nr:Hypothetical predicted protein [Mytilus galloprovincialis]
MVGTKSNTCSPTFVGDLTDEAKHLINSALTPSTKASYQKTWQKLIEFLGHQQISLPLQLAQVANFIGNLFTKGLKPATIASHISALSYVGLNPTQYKGHSFRIGAATNAASLGYSEQLIQKLGRWNSNALQRYIRIESIRM